MKDNELVNLINRSMEGFVSRCQYYEQNQNQFPEKLDE